MTFKINPLLLEFLAIKSKLNTTKLLVICFSIFSPSQASPILSKLKSSWFGLKTSRQLSISSHTLSLSVSIRQLPKQS